MKGTAHMSALLAVVKNSLRLAILTQLTLEPASAANLATQLEAPLEQVRYEIKCLRQADLVGIHSQGERRGAIEHTYIAKCRNTTFSTESGVAGSARRLREVDLGLLPVLFKEALEATRAGAFQDCDDYFLIRIPLCLDREGCREVSAISDAALERLFGIRDECLMRSAETGASLRSANSALLFFEIPD